MSRTWVSEIPTIDIRRCRIASGHRFSDVAGPALDSSGRRRRTTRSVAQNELGKIPSSALDPVVADTGFPVPRSERSIAGSLRESVHTQRRSQPVVHPLRGLCRALTCASATGRPHQQRRCCRRARCRRCPGCQGSGPEARTGLHGACRRISGHPAPSGACWILRFATAGVLTTRSPGFILTHASI